MMHVGRRLLMWEILVKQRSGFFHGANRRECNQAMKLLMMALFKNVVNCGIN